VSHGAELTTAIAGRESVRQCV